MSHAEHTHDRKHESGDACCGSNSGACCGSSTFITETNLPLPSSGRSFHVSGLDCVEEVGILNNVLGPEIGGADHLAFDVLNARMTVLQSGKSISDDQIIKIVNSTGMTAKIWDAKSSENDQAAHLKRQKTFTALSGGFWATGFLYHAVEMGPSGALHLFSGHGQVPMPLVEVILFMLAIIFGGWLVAPKAWSATRRLAPDMNLLMIVAVSGAIGLGEYFEAATVAFFFALSLTLESWSVGRARNAVSALLNLSPPTARLIQPDLSEAEVPASQVAIGDRFIVRGGDRIPLDGEVVSGAGSVDQAPITGESALVAKERGDEVYAGTINGEGTLTISATKTAGDSVLSKIIRMVGDAHTRRAPVEQWVTKFARIYTPVIMVMAILIAAMPPLLFGGQWSYWLYNALVLLVIACPCALVISTPVSIVAALASSARNGVLIKGGAYIEAPSQLTALAMDKTGTITQGHPEVAALHTLNKTLAHDLLTKAAALEMHSSHPLARAILLRAEHEGLDIVAAKDIRTVPGRGVEGQYKGQNIWLGSDRFAKEKKLGDGIPNTRMEQIESVGNTLVFVGDDKQLLGVIELRDSIRPDAKDMITALHKQGVQKIIMLTGDNARTAQAVAKAVGIDEVRAELLPDDKMQVIEDLTREYDMVAMIGDGVNDAPAMARAHFAIAMGAIGSDAAIETADIALMSDDIGKVPWLIGHSRRTMAIIRQNIGVALATKAVFVVLTAFGLASMWGAIAADVGISFLVIANALRLLRIKT